MPVRSQPLDDRVTKKLKLDTDVDYLDKTIMSQRIGRMFDDICSDDMKIPLKTRIGWRWQKFKDFLRNIKHTIRNHIKWHKTMRQLRSWEGFDGLITVMQTHLRDYIGCEEKHGHSDESCKMNKTATVNETVELLERMREPIDYSSRRRDAVEAKYPDYQSLITEYKASTSVSGDFVAQGNGWVGKESGNNPREGYFEFIDGRFELVASPNQAETDRIIAELREYHQEINNAYNQAEVDSDEDFDRLAKLLKENMYTWWD